MSIAGPSYLVARPTRQCAQSGRVLETGERYVATLVEVPEQEDLARLDFAEDAWQSGARPQPPLALFGFWRGVIGDETSTPKQLLDDEELLDLFEQLHETVEPRRIAFRFVLALALIRKRLLIYEGGVPADAKRGVQGSMQVRRRGDQDKTLSEVIDPGMDDEAIEAATDQIGNIMNMDAGSPRKGS